MTRPDDTPIPAEVAPRLGLSHGWVRALIKRWDDDEPDGPADRRKAKNGGRPKLSTDQVANAGFDDLGALQRPQIERCRWLMAHPETVRGAVGFDWAVALNN